MRANPQSLIIPQFLSHIPCNLIHTDQMLWDSTQLKPNILPMYFCLFIRIKIVLIIHIIHLLGWMSLLMQLIHHLLHPTSQLLLRSHNSSFHKLILPWTESTTIPFHQHIPLKSWWLVNWYSTCLVWNHISLLHKVINSSDCVWWNGFTWTLLVIFFILWTCSRRVKAE